MLRKTVTVAMLALLLPAATPAVAAVKTGIGPRFGFSVDPDQVVFGGQIVIGEVAPSMTFDPNLELGLGDDVTTVGLSFDLHYHFAITNSEWRPYLGAGVGVHFFDVDQPPPLRDDTSTETGGNFIIGAGVPTRSGSRFFTELKLGLGDIPSLKMLAGWVFKM